MGLLDFFSTAAENQAKRANRVLNDYERKNGSNLTSSQRERLDAKREQINNYLETGSYSRRTDDEFEKLSEGENTSADSFQYRENVDLPNAIYIANTQSGVYVLRLDGAVMKCGSAINPHVRGRLRQYYNLNYDNEARSGNYWSVSPENKDRVTVSWQCCPKSKCRELEARLFKKYGRGPWTKRVPDYNGSDTWKLLI